MMGKVFNIQSFSTTDGPGIRTVVFFQGCNLRCAWCHNPESQPVDAPEAFLPEKCIGCGACKTGGECYAKARTVTSRDFTPEELWKLLSIDVPYLKNSGGGVTFSGGECLLQPEFLREMIQLCRANDIHTAVDTAGHVPYERLIYVRPDMFLYDIKALPTGKHKELTGVDGVLIWENLERLIRENYRVQVRIPCVPGANWDEIAEIIARLKKMGVTDIEPMAYHRLGEGKAAIYGIESQIFEAPSKKEMEEIWNLLDCQKT